MAELTIDIDDFEARLPRPFHDDHERRRAALLFQDAVAIIREAVEEAGYAPADWVAVERNKRRAILVAHSMVATAIMIGENVGVMQVSTTTGPYTESTSYSGRIANPSLWGGVELTDWHLEFLGLLSKQAPIASNSDPYLASPESSLVSMYAAPFPGSVPIGGWYGNGYPGYG